MFDGTLKFDTAIDKTGFKLGLGSLGSIAKAGMTAVTAAVGAASGAVAALGGYAVSVGKGFEASMAQVIATMGITKDSVIDGANSYELLKKAAADAGETTTFSASEAADALNYLALAGYDAVKAADALPSVLDLAAAGGLDLAYASDLATDAMAALGIEATGENLTHFGDQMAKTASKANTSVAQLGEAILTVGGTAKALAGGTTELNAALGVLANVGIKGSEGGTALRNVILALSAPTDKAAEELENLGVKAFDANGDLRPLNDVFKDLDASLSGMSEGEKTKVLNNIFNKVDLKSAQALLAGCGGEFDKLSDAIENSGGAMAQMADTMNDTLEGDLKALGSKAEAFGISVYESLNEPLRKLVTLGGDYISQLNAALSEGDFSSLASSLGDVLGQAVTQLSSYVPGLVDMGVSLVQSLVQGISENSGQISESLVSALQSLVIGGFEITKDMVKLGCELILQLAHGFAEALPDILAEAVSLAEAVVNSVSEALPEFLSVLSESAPMIFEAGMSVLGELMRGLTENLPIIIETAIKILSSLAKSVSENLPLFLTAALELLTALAASIIENLPMLLEAAIGIITSLVTWISENIGPLIDAAVNILMMLVDFIIDNLPMLIDACLEIITQLVKGLFQYMPKIMEAGIKILLKLIEGLINAIPQLFKAVPKIISAIWDAVTETDWLSLGKNILLGIADGLSKGLSAIWGAITDVCESIWNKFTDFFGIHSPSTLFRDELGKFMLPGMVIGVESTENTAASGINSSLEKVEKQIKPIQLPKPETPDIDTKIVKYEVPQLEVEFAGPEIPPIDVEFNKPEIPPIETDIPKAEIKSETVYIFDKDGIDEKDDFPKFYTPKAEYDAVEEIKVIRFDNDSLKALESARLTMNTGFSQPSPMSEITNNYNYSTVNKGADTTASQNITIPVSLVMDGQIIAEGLANIVLDEVDKQQGVTVQMKKRGIAQ